MPQTPSSDPPRYELHRARFTADPTTDPDRSRTRAASLELAAGIDAVLQAERLLRIARSRLQEVVRRHDTLR